MPEIPILFFLLFPILVHSVVFCQMLLFSVDFYLDFILNHHPRRNEQWNRKQNARCFLFSHFPLASHSVKFIFDLCRGLSRHMCTFWPIFYFLFVFAVKSQFHANHFLWDKEKFLYSSHLHIGAAYIHLPISSYNFYFRSFFNIRFLFFLFRWWVWKRKERKWNNEIQKIWNESAALGTFPSAKMTFQLTVDFITCAHSIKIPHECTSTHNAHTHILLSYRYWLLTDEWMNQKRSYLSFITLYYLEQGKCHWVTRTSIKW